MDAPRLLSAVERALAAPPARGADDSSTPVDVPGALVLILVDGAALEAAAAVLPPLLRVLGAPGLRRPLLVAASESEVRPSRAEVQALLGPVVPGATLVVHDADGSHHFRPGSTSHGVPIELDDVLLEAEVLVTVGEVRRDPCLGWVGGAGLVFPGLASRRSRAALRALAPGPEGSRLRWQEAEEARAHAPVDFQLCWVEPGPLHGCAWASAGRVAEGAARASVDRGS